MPRALSRVLLDAAVVAGAVSLPMARLVATVDQQRVRRTRTGLIAHDLERAQPGYTLLTPMFGDGTVYLVDMPAAVAHTWHPPYRPGRSGQRPDTAQPFYSAQVLR